MNTTPLPAASPWHLLADDLTGALDTAAAWAARNEVPVFLDRPGDAAQAVQCVVSGTRDVPEAELPQRLAPSLDWLADCGHAYKKIDSLLRGNTYAEIAWLLRSGRFEGAVFAPAFPAQGRYTAQDSHWVAAPHQPHGPRRHVHPQPLSQALADVGLQAWRPTDLAHSLRHPGTGPLRVTVPDLLCNADLQRLAALAHTFHARRWLWCGSAGLAWALARHDGQTDAPAGASPTPPPPPATDILLLTASRHPVLREQWRQLAPQSQPGLRCIDLAPAEPLTPEQAALQLAQAMRRLLAAQPRPQRLLVVGGDTLLALCRAADVRSLLAAPGLRPGWGGATLCGGLWDGLRCDARSGAFGPPDDLNRLLALLQPRPTSMTLEEDAS